MQTKRSNLAIVDGRTPCVDEKAAAFYLGMSLSYLRNARWRGIGPRYLKIGASVRYRIQDLDAFLEERLVATG